MRVVVSTLLFLVAGAASAAEADKALARIKAVSKEGAGNQEAGAAWKDLVAIGGEALFPTLNALDDASPAAANWLRSAVNAVAQKEAAAGRKLPADKLEAFLKDMKHAPVSRRLAYELLAEVDPKAPERLLPGMMNDPSVELRRDSIDAALKKAEKLEGEPGKTELLRIFASVREQDQAEKIVKSLDKFGTKADVNAHFGVIADWMLAGPFDSTKNAGFNKAYEPEKKVDLAATYKGKGDVEVKWKRHTTMSPYGVVDLNKALDKHKEAVAYAFTVVESDKERPVEIRFGCIVAIKLFLNGKELFDLEEYHHGDRFDQYLVRTTLKAGKNELLLKVCQNNQTEQWAQVWTFQLRICDATGGSVPVKVALPK
jgi:hypothetical protein